MDFTEAKIYRNDPIKLLSYLNKNVKILTQGNEIFQGNVYTIDPVSESVILVNKYEDRTSLDLVFGHAVKSMEIIGDGEASELFHNEKLQVDSEAKKRLKTWLEQNLIPVEEDGDVLKCCSILTIDPPYTSQSCLCPNEIVLNKIQQLILNLPP